MSIKPCIVLLLLLTVSSVAQVQHFLPTSQVVEIATTAAKDEGYDVTEHGTYLDVLRTSEGKEPYAGYTSIGLYDRGRLVRSYSIRIETGDVVDPTQCAIFEYPNLLAFNSRLIKAFGSKQVSSSQIASEIGCARLKPLPDKTAGK